MASDRIREYRGEKTVILDTSAVMMLFEFSINLEIELTMLLGKISIVVPSSVVDELKYLSTDGKGKKKINAKASLKLIERYAVANTDVKPADESVLILAQKLNGIVVTNDRELRNNLKKAKIKTIFLRGKTKLALE
jgi:rRNA-processing protein FCF1